MKKIKAISIPTSNQGFALLPLMVATTLLALILINSINLTGNISKQTLQSRRVFAKNNFEQNLVTLFSHNTLCSCNLSSPTPLSIPATGSADVPGLKLSCGAPSYDFYLKSSSGFSVDPLLNVNSITISKPTLISGSNYNAVLAVNYKLTPGLTPLADGQYIFSFSTVSASAPYDVSTCSVTGPLSGFSSGWSITGNAGLDATVNYIGTNDNVDFNLMRNNLSAGRLATTLTSFGVQSLASNAGGVYNSAFGVSSLTLNTTGKSNTAFGDSSLKSNTIGSANSALGTNALSANLSSSNSALGSSALQLNTTGSLNTAIGTAALQSNTIGVSNTGVGWRALQANTTGSYNSALGYAALMSNVAANYNTAVGLNSLTSNTSGQNNSSVGYYALASNTTGNDNLGSGHTALYFNSTGSMNTALGFLSLKANSSGSSNTALGADNLMNNTTGNLNTAAGGETLSHNITGSNNIAFGHWALSASQNTSDNLAFGENAMGSNTEFMAPPPPTGTLNTAFGWYALKQYTSGQSSVAVGAAADQNSFTSSSVVAFGAYALNSQSSTPNVAVGYRASANVASLSGNPGVAVGSMAAANMTSGASTAVGFNSLLNSASNSVAIGAGSLINNSVGYNIVFGKGIMPANTSGNYNDAFGVRALDSNVSGSNNVAFGVDSLKANTSGSENTAVGVGALRLETGDYNSALGANSGAILGGAIVTGSQDTFIGINSGMLGVTAVNNSTAIGFGAIVGKSNSIVLGTTLSKVGIGLTNPTYMLELSTHSAAKPGSSTWNTPSDARLKNVRASFIKSFAELDLIQPVYYRYKKENALKLSSENQYVGVIAQNAQAGVSESVSKDNLGYLHVQIDAITWTMVNAVKEFHGKFLRETQVLNDRIEHFQQMFSQIETKQKNLESKNKAIETFICKQSPRSSICVQ